MFTFTDNPLKRNVVIVLLFTTLVAAAFAIYFYLQVSRLTQNPQQVAAQQAKDLVDAVGKLILLPPNEMPTVATVTDPVPLASQPFFANAQKGDKVLIYTTAKKAILYSPAENKIVEVAPINIGPNQTTSTAVKK